jgi:spore maturation protein CgeB
MKIVILGLSVTSSWGNGHATTYRSLIAGLARRGHDVLFLERDQPWYRANRDLPRLPVGRVALYRRVSELRGLWREVLRDADLVMVGSFVPDGKAVCRQVLRTARGITAFYDIDTPVTLARLDAGDCAYLDTTLIPAFDLYLSFTGGPALDHLEARWGARAARALYCSAGSTRLVAATPRWELGYLGTYSADRQPILERLLCRPARRLPGKRFVVAGPQYPEAVAWPANCTRIDHVAPNKHRAFYRSQRFTLNLTRADMVRLGHSPSVRLFEAAAAGVPIISDWWRGLDAVFEPDAEILIARSTDDVLRHLSDVSEARRHAIAAAARRRVMAAHTGAHRAAELERHVVEARERRPMQRRAARAGGDHEARDLRPLDQLDLG